MVNLHKIRIQFRSEDFTCRVWMLKGSANEFQELLNLCPHPPKIVHKLVGLCTFLSGVFSSDSKRLHDPKQVRNFPLGRPPPPFGYHTATGISGPHCTLSCCEDLHELTSITITVLLGSKLPLLSPFTDEETEKQRG